MFNRDESFVLGSPISIVGTRGSSCDLCDQILKSSPEVYFLEERVHPAIDDAVALIELVLMVPMMLIVAEN